MKPLLAAGRAFVDGLIQLVYPNACWVCGTAMQTQPLLVCDDCTARLTRDPFPTCPRCSSSVGPHANVQHGCPACRTETFAFDGAFRMGPYADELRNVILRMKHAAGEDLADVVGTLWANTLADRLADERVDAVVPIPLHWSRRWQRGFNQSEVLAECLAQRLGVPCQPRWLRRTRRTPMQSAQASATARRQNVRGAFAARGQPALAGKTVLLVDDVLTTGATASEAARALRPFKPRRILVAVLAHGA